MIGVQHIVRRDMALVAAAALLSFMLVDLFPGPTVLLALMIGCLGAIGTRRRRPWGRTMLDAFAEVTFSVITLVVLALSLR